MARIRPALRIRIKIPKRPATPMPAPPVVLAVNPDHAWKALGLVVDWIKHAETKAGVTLAATGVTGGVLFNLIKDVKHPSWCLLGSMILCGVSVAAAGLCAGMVLWPRLRMKESPTSPLYFHHIARGHAAPDTYAVSLAELTKGAEALVTEIASQAWANSVVARKKYFWGGVAIRFLLLALVALSITAAIRAAA